MRWLKNLIGYLKGYSCCKHCRDNRYWKEDKNIYVIDSESIFALCKECFKKLSVEDIITYYELVLNQNISSYSLYWDRAKINKARKTLIENIIKEKKKLK